MRLLFGISADGRIYPDHPGARGGIDEAVVGPMGLIETLEVQLGLSAPGAPRAVRIASYVAKLAATPGDRFWTTSFVKDAWSTAALLLDWRDGLVAGGWRRTAVGAARADDLAQAETAGELLPAGLADRLIGLLDAVGTRPGLRLQKLTLLEPRARLPLPWRRLIGALETVGVAIEEATATPGAPAATDLGRVQTFLENGQVQPLDGDGSLALVEADTALMAAEAIADWISAGGPDGLPGTLVLAPDGDTALLDQALQARGLPRLGLSSASPWRGALQVLPLAFEIAWAPFKPEALLNLLSLPRPPIGRYAASRLSRALVSSPGLHGPEWSAAWTDIEERLRAQEEGAADASEADRKIAQRITRWRAWTEGGRISRAAGMSLEEARLIAGRVAEWALQTDSGRGDPLMLGVAGAASAFVEAVERLGADRLSPLLIERILSQVLADGVANPDHVAEAGGLRAVQAPGAICGPAARVVWWGFVGPGERIAASPWSRAEIAALEAAGVTVETPAEAAQRVSATYSDALKRAGTSALLVRPSLSGGDETVAHPLAHQLQPLLKPALHKIRWRAEQLLQRPEVTLAGRTWRRSPVEVRVPPQPKLQWAGPAVVRERLKERYESASSLERLVNCQLAWVARDVLELRSGSFAELPGPDQLFGNLAHEIANQLLPPGPPPPIATVRPRATELFDELLPVMAAPLQQPELAGELALARARVPLALEALVRLLVERGLEIEGTELEREGVVGALRLNGRLDLIVRQGARRAVIDLKWTRSTKRYREMVAGGRAVQLAVYGAIADPASVELAPGGFFLLRQRQMIAEQGSILAEQPIPVDRDQAATLQALAEDWRVWSDLAAKGVVLAAGVDGSEALRPDGLGFEPAEDPCRYCELGGLCRVRAEAA